MQQFADFLVKKLAEQYDLLIIDHPCVGCAAATECVLPLEEYLSKEYLNDQLQNSVGGSHESYNYDGHNGHWQLTQQCLRPVIDLTFLKKLEEKFRQHGKELLAWLKKEKGRCQLFL